MKQSIDVNQDYANQADGCWYEANSYEGSLLQVINDNPHLSGVDAVKLHEAETTALQLKYRNEIQEKLQEVSGRPHQSFRFEREGDTYYVLAKSYQLESEIYVIFEGIKVGKHYGKDTVTFLTDERYSYSFFESLNPNFISPEKVREVMQCFQSIQSNML